MESNQLEENEEFELCGFLVWNGKKFLDHLDQEPKKISDVVSQDERQI
jgi:hypothetical protein